MEKKTYKCLVASPGDTKFEREACVRVFDEINKGIGDKFGFVIEKRMWEHNTRPALGEYSQAVINDQLGDDYHIFVGIMYMKYGTETKEAGSGTEEEFNRAFERASKKDPVEIMFYFNDESAKPSEINANDLAKINAFKEKIAVLGTYYWTYNGSANFEQIFRSQLTEYFLKLFNVDKKELRQQKIQSIIIRDKLKERLDIALKAFNSQPIIWVDPILSNTNEISENPDENYTKRVDVYQIINSPSSLVIKAPPQFGLTSLAHFLVLHAFDKGTPWVYLDANKTKSHNIHNAVSREAEWLDYEISSIKAIILDSWKNYEVDSFKKLKSLCDSYPEIPIIVMHTIDDQSFLKESTEIDITREFELLHLLALPRTQIRKVVSEYNKTKEIGAEDQVLTKVVSDLEMLNIHRTPMNCLTLLKVCEKYFDESPVNRTDMIEKVLFVLFNTDEIPRYRTKPDLKDCEYVLGRYCEMMIRADKYYFTREEFINELRSFCKEKLIDLEVDIVFDILILNNILIRSDNGFNFRSAYWVYYFAARRMHNNQEFAEYIFSSKKYVAFPEIIEFYTGIDRSKVDALTILTRDTKETCDIVGSKVGLPDHMDLFSLIRWEPTTEQIQLLQNELSENVINSGLPEDIKDRHADRSYNQIRPYNQGIQTLFTDYSLYNLMQQIKAASRALRNSDYVNPDTKIAALQEIIRSWEQISNVLMTLTPILADKGEADFEGELFYLSGNFGDTIEERKKRIILVNLTNVVGFFKEDIYSSKIAPLLYDFFNNETNSVKKHQVALLLIFCRPRGWRKQIEDYIVTLPKNSFYLFDTFSALKVRYNYDFTTEEEFTDLSYLIKMCFVKHEYGSKKPGIHEISKIKINKPKSQE